MKISFKSNSYSITRHLSKLGARRCAVAGCIALVWLASSAGAHAAAIVTDVIGKVQVQGGAGPLTILSEIESNARLQLDSGARVVVLYSQSGDEFAMAGPALIHFRPDAPVALSGKPPQKRTSPLAGGAVRIKPMTTAQAAFVMRSASAANRITLLSLSGTRTLDLSPEFRWQQAGPGLKYRFELMDDGGRVLFEAEVEDAALTLPAANPLRPGASYTWEVSARLVDGRRIVGAGDFSTADAALRARAAAMRPAQGAPVSARVAYAAWLTQAELRDEARKYWRALAAERPHDTRLQSLAR
jgi:hypothetical protein